MIEAVKSAEAQLIEVIRSATRALDGIGSESVSAALREFEEAKRNALARLKSQADAVRGSLEQLAGDALDVAKQLAFDLAAPAPKKDDKPIEATAQKTAPEGKVEPSGENVKTDNVAPEKPIDLPASTIIADAVPDTTRPQIAAALGSTTPTSTTAVKGEKGEKPDGEPPAANGRKRRQTT